MHFRLLVCLLLATFVCAQTAPAPAPAPATNGVQGAPPAPANTPAASAPEPPKLNPDDPVITIKGLCADSALQEDTCKTVITKAQFDKLADTLQPGMPPAMRRQLASRYAQLLSMSAEAEKRGLDKTPHFEEAMKFARMQVLSGELNKSLQADANNISDQDIQDFYHKNAANYEQATFVKIFVPRTKRIENPPLATAKGPARADSSAAAANSKPTEEQQKAGEEAMKKEASLLRDRLLKGEDPDKLEQAAFTAAGLQGNPPPTKMESIRRNGLPLDQQSVMELKPGEVSEVLSNTGGNFIYKLVSKEEMPLDKAKNEIRSQLANQHYREAIQHFQTGFELNEDYFGPARPGMPMPPRGRPASNSGDTDPDRD